ncbi:MAG: methyl-accepting chemotaxis protein [Bacteroidia bacterium]|jgi:methyl-accepting chemotaxis protein|nr:methyl-accepting chemotaxis protein [Bacteroidia bacterium]
MALGNNIRKSANGASAPEKTENTPHTEPVITVNENMEALVAENKRLQQQFELINSSCMFFEMTPEGIFTSANEAFANITGYPEEELTGRSFTEIYHADMGVDFFADIRMTLEEGEIFSSGIKMRTRSGEEIWLETTIKAIQYDALSENRYFATAYNITEYMAESQRMVGLFSAINASYSYAEFDTDASILHANENFMQLMGYDIFELAGKKHSIFVKPEVAASDAYRELWDKLRAGETLQGQTSRITKSGEEVWLNSTTSSIKDDQGKVMKIFNFATDITPQKREELAVKAAAEEAGRVINRMAEGDLSQRFSIEAEGEMRKMGESLNHALENVSNLITNISQVASLIASSAEELLTKGEQMMTTTSEVATAIQQMAEGAQQQAEQTDESSKLIDDVLKSANDMGKKAETIHKMAENGQKDAAEGLNTIRNVVENMSGIQTAAQTTSKSIEVLSERSEEIARTLSIITDIASQTNLLALNAAIEAARAGDAGRGFAVVAEEIRKLAEDSRKSAVDIEKVIREVHKDVNSAGKSIDLMQVSVKQGTTASREAELVFQNIERFSNNSLGNSKDILDATEKQRESIANTVRNIEKIVVVAEETASGTEEIAASSKEISLGMNEVTATSRDLAEVANQLQLELNKFSL